MLIVFSSSTSVDVLVTVVVLDDINVDDLLQQNILKSLNSLYTATNITRFGKCSILSHLHSLLSWSSVL